MVWSSCLKSIKGENGLGNLSLEVAYLRSMQEIMSLSSTTTTTTCQYSGGKGKKGQQFKVIILSHVVSLRQKKNNKVKEIIVQHSRVVKH